MTLEEIKKIQIVLTRLGYKKHHDSFAKGYVRKDCSDVIAYNGRFGTGAIIKYANNLGMTHYGKSSKNYYVIEYWIKK